MQELGKQNPDLLQMINGNQEEFLRMINEPAAQGSPDMAELAAQLGGGGGELKHQHLVFDAFSMDACTKNRAVISTHLHFCRCSFQ